MYSKTGLYISVSCKPQKIRKFYLHSLYWRFLFSDTAFLSLARVWFLHRLNLQSFVLWQTYWLFSLMHGVCCGSMSIVWTYLSLFPFFSFLAFGFCFFWSVLQIFYMAFSLFDWLKALLIAVFNPTWVLCVVSAFILIFQKIFLNISAFDRNDFYMILPFYRVFLIFKERKMGIWFHAGSDSSLWNISD